uniref:Dihydrolipoamide acetyltransferase component of pyruvate dehydrogenase complex n=1 Tax=Trypanosoma congolense (strain IL3000) TaxID=1068625 RepID=G0UM71_TRYCI|nr:putative dihydrolipoamide branched chain transacylase [Trypanosoma congolense IL3000]
MRSFVSLCRCASITHFACSNRLRLVSVVPYRLADIGEGIQEVEVVTLFVKPGDRIEEFDKICEVQSDKATVEITSKYAGVVSTVHVTAGGKAQVGEPIVDIDVSGAAGGEVTQCDGAISKVVGTEKVGAGSSSTQMREADALGEERAIGTSGGTGKVLATPAVRELARSQGINIVDVKGTGEGGRVLRDDVLSHVGGGRCDGDVVVRLDTGLRKAMVSAMTKAGSIPSYTACDEVEVSKLLNFRQVLYDALNPVTHISKPREGCGVKVSLMPLFIKAASFSLMQFPELNAHVSPECDKLFVKKAHNIGFAMDTSKGLVVPVVRDVHLKSIAEVVREVNNLIALGQVNQIPPDCMRDGTFTLSNIGSIGATYATPMLNPPQVAIGAIGRIQQLPRFDSSGALVKANVVAVSWTADHRVIDGATLVRFSNAFKHFLGAPGLMLANEMN